MAIATETPVLGLAAFSGTGKTILLRNIIPLLKARGMRLGLVKHSHHVFEIDKPGKDSYRLTKAGAAQMLVASSRRTVLTINHTDYEKIDLYALLKQLDNGELDLILVEGFKYYPIPKIEIYRSDLGHPLLCRSDPVILAVVTDSVLPADIALPILELNNSVVIADFIQNYMLKAKSQN